jgi:hypothetical protein
MRYVTVTEMKGDNLVLMFSDGSRETQKVRNIGKPRKARKAPQRRTAKELYPEVPGQYRDEWSQLVRIVEGKKVKDGDESGLTWNKARARDPSLFSFVGPVASIIYAKAKAHEGRGVSARDLQMAAYHGCLRAYLQWRQRNTGPALEEGKLNARLQSWMKTDAERRVIDLWRSFQSGAKNSFPVDPDSIDIEGEALYPWLDFEEMESAIKMIPDSVDQALVATAHWMVHRPGELEKLMPEFKFPESLSFAGKENRWMVELALATLFCLSDSLRLCPPQEVEPRLKRFARWFEHWKVFQVGGKPIPARDSGGRPWTGPPRGPHGLQHLNSLAARWLRENQDAVALALGLRPPTLDELRGRSR